MCTYCQEMEHVKKRLSDLETENKEIKQLIAKMNTSGTIETLSVKEAAVLLRKSSYTVSEWCKEGKIKTTRNGKEGMYIISMQAIQDFLNSKTLNHA